MFKLSQETNRDRNRRAHVGRTGLLRAQRSTGGSRSHPDGDSRRPRAIRAEARADRADAQAAREVIRADAQAAREVIRAENRADREAFEKHITRLTQEQSRLTGIVEQMRTAGR